MLRPRIRRRCVSLAAAPADSWLHTARDNRDTETMERLVTQNSAQRGRPAVPDHWTGRPGGSGAQPPLHLIYMVKVGRSLNSSIRRAFSRKVRCNRHGELSIAGDSRNLAVNSDWQGRCEMVSGQMYCAWALISYCV